MRAKISDEVKFEIEKRIEGEVRCDSASRILFSTDASIYQVAPLGVAFPKHVDDLIAILEICSKNNIPVLPRGSGSSLAGQTVGDALVLDCSRYMNGMEDINLDENTAWVQPGLVLSTFNKALENHKLQFGPDPASADRATLGGMFGNNSTGAHSIIYGMSSDHLLEAEMVLSDGSFEKFSSSGFEEINKICQGQDLKSRIYSAALQIQAEYGDIIREKWPKTWRNSSGYALNYLIPWSETRPPRWGEGPYPPQMAGKLNLAPVLVGSEGTLGIFARLKVNLVSIPHKKVLAVLAFGSVAEAADATPGILASKPSAVELVPNAIISKARTIPAYAARLSFLGGNPSALLLVEYSGEDKGQLSALAKKLGPDVLVLEDDLQQQQLWEVRKVGLGLLMYMAGDEKPVPFIEDVAVPVENLGDFVREFERIVAEYGTRGDFYAHASAGCLHIRPVINLKTDRGINMMRGITSDLVEVILRFKGALSGEHGDGQARGEWLEKVYGGEITEAFQKLKQSADPQGILNPGKIVAPIPMDKNLRFGIGYATKHWIPLQDYSDVDGFAGAIEMCNGAGVCRQATGSMCPSFQASHEEMHSTRGRANLLRELISEKHLFFTEAEQAAFESLSLCLACKGCKAECPSAVDVAKLKYEFLNNYYTDKKRPMRDYLFGYIGELAKFGMPVSGLANMFFESSFGKGFLEKYIGISSNRTLPHLVSSHHKLDPPRKAIETVILLADPFSKYFAPELIDQTQELLTAVGCSISLLPVVGAGRTKISKGMLGAAKKHALTLMDALEFIDPLAKSPIIILEPSELSMIQDDIFSLLPDDERVETVSNRCFSLEEFLLRPTQGGSRRFETLNIDGSGHSIMVHGHCHQKAQIAKPDGFPSGVQATIRVFEEVGCSVELVDAGCCGMAGAFGYEKENYSFSIKVAELRLLPAVRNKDKEQLVCATGASCRTQIENCTQTNALHPVTILHGLR